MPKKFRKIPVVIEAVQLLPNYDSIREVEEFLNGAPIDASIYSRNEAEFDKYVSGIIADGGRKLKTMESQGEHQFAKFADWIIKGIQGEFYPCDNEVFQKTYESVG
jgi:hypothetical protein